ncbi:MAG: hypothetical protein ACRDIC_15850 [bacterium]
MDSNTRLIDHRTWEKIAPEFRKRWQERFPNTAEQWEAHEPYYRYGYEMAYDPRFEHREWLDVEADLKTKYPEWAEQSGYMYDEHESAWDRFKDAVRDAWETVTGRR